MGDTRKGRCLCGSVTYEVTGPLRPVCACHCTQCRRTSGHFVAATQVLSDDLRITGDGLKWFRSSDEAERGFCEACGSNLFWRRLTGRRTSIFAGTLDSPTGLLMTSQIHTGSAGDYYELPTVPIVEQSDLS